MDKKTIVLIAVILVAVVALLGIYYTAESPSYGDVETLSVYSEGSIDLSVIIRDIENSSYYEGYDNETINWMKSLGDKKVFSGNGTFVIMSSADAGQLHSEWVTDAYIVEDFECNVLEAHPLGDVKYPHEVIYVENVKYLGETVYSDLGGA